MVNVIHIANAFIPYELGGDPDFDTNADRRRLTGSMSSPGRNKLTLSEVIHFWTQLGTFCTILILFNMLHITFLTKRIPICVYSCEYVS